MGKQVSWTREQKQQAAIQYAIQGSLKKITDGPLSIPSPTVCGWKKEDWWVALVEEVRSEKAEEHRAQYCKIIDKAQEQTLKALPKATAQQAMIIAGVGTDKVRLHDGLATSITGKAESKEDLLNKFAKIAQEYNRNVVSTQHQKQSST